jgi:glyoxylase-like metal-dependent hydrolase (beta-lactamase superfamily II)
LVNENIFRFVAVNIEMKIYLVKSLRILKHTTKGDGIINITAQWTPLSKDVSVFHGAVNVGLIQSDNHAILIDCCDSLTLDELKTKGITIIDKIFITQHKCPNCAGMYALKGKETQLIVPKKLRDLFCFPQRYWEDSKNRWHIYHFQPDTQIIAKSIRVDETATEGQFIQWRDWIIQIIDTPGMSTGAVSYVIQNDTVLIVFCGDIIYSGGKLWDFHSLQAAADIIIDYHGFGGSYLQLFHSLDKIAQLNASIIVPSHGPVVYDFDQATATLKANLTSYLQNFASVSSLNHFFPSLNLYPKSDSQQMIIGTIQSDPNWIRYIGGTSYLVVSRTKEALLIDCGSKVIVQKLMKLIKKKSTNSENSGKTRNEITSIIGCWITHFHDDHIDGLPLLQQKIGCPILLENHIASILMKQDGYYLPGISPTRVKDPMLVRDGEKWIWNEFTITAYFFPGQTLYHSGLFIEGPNENAFFAGDSFSPRGIDDYCAHNRIFLRKKTGYFRCLEILLQLHPDRIYNQHIQQPFHFTNEQLIYIQNQLYKRLQLMKILFPHEDPNYALDPYWVRCIPYEQRIHAGEECEIFVEITNHSVSQGELHVYPMIPCDWIIKSPISELQMTVLPLTEGIVSQAIGNSDGSLCVCLKTPTKSKKGKYIIPMQIMFKNHYWGQICHAIVNIN